MEQQPTPPQPSRLEAARRRVVAARWLLAIAAGAGFGWALLGAKLANPGEAPPSDAQDAPTTSTGTVIPASAPTPAPAETTDPDALLDEFFGDAAIAPDAGEQDDAAPDSSGATTVPAPSRKFAPLPRPRTRAS